LAYADARYVKWSQAQAITCMNLILILRQKAQKGLKFLFETRRYTVFPFWRYRRRAIMPRLCYMGLRCLIHGTIRSELRRIGTTPFATKETRSGSWSNLVRAPATRLIDSTEICSKYIVRFHSLSTVWLPHGPHDSIQPLALLFHCTTSCVLYSTTDTNEHLALRTAPCLPADVQSCDHEIRK
jgi:hypothetical protein